METIRSIMRRNVVVATITALVAGVGATPALAAPPHDHSIGDVTVVEGDTGTVMATFAITYSGPAGASTVDWATADGTATAGSDYTASSGTASLPAGGCKCVNLSVPVLGDEDVEGAETFVVNLSNPSTGGINDGQGVGTITNDDAAPPAASVADASADEDAGPLAFTVSLSEAPTSTVTVDYATSDGSAVAGDDYTSTSGTVTFVAGDAEEVVNVTLVDDALDENDETFDLTLSNPSGTTILDDVAVGTIADDDAAPSVSIDDVAVGEGGSPSLTVTVDAASAKTVTVGYETVDGTATEPGDYTPASGTLTFVPGDTSEAVDVAVVDDAVLEPIESFGVVLSDPVNVTIGDRTGAVTITDDDVVPSVGVDDVSVDEGDAGATPATFTLSQSAATALDTTVDFVVVDGTAVIGEDVAAASGTATIPAGETSVAVSVDVLGDTVDEFDETFTVELSNAANATIGDTEATGTIVDDDATVSSITLKAKKTAKKVVAKGTLEPATSDREVLVILQKKVKGERWKAVAKKRVAVTQLLDRDADGHEDGAYQAAFKRPATGRYRFVAKVGATLDATAVVGIRGFKI